eukprot:XP_019920726.1 PREDICTED: uncharacterized protein LOC109617997 [Crassostrea gigas]
MYMKKQSKTVMNIMTICTFHVMLFQIFIVESNLLNMCTNINGTLECCEGYKLDIALDTCIPCERGFTGINCVTNCIYPSYGQDCQSLCDCNATYCHYANGCIRFSEYQSQSTTHMNFRTVPKEHITLDSNSSDNGKYDSA